MSKRTDIQDATGVIERLAGRGVVEAWGTGAPTSSIQGYAPGCIYHRVDGGAGTSLYVNEGTFASSTWVAVITNDATGNDTFATVTVTTLLRGGTSGLTINAANTGSSTLGLGGSSDTVYLGSSTAGNATAALGLGAPSNDTAHINNGTGSAMSIGFNSTGNLGSSSYTFADLVYMLKAKGLLKF